MCGNRQPGRILNPECKCSVCGCHKDPKPTDTTEVKTQGQEQEKTNT